MTTEIIMTTNINDILQKLRNTKITFGYDLAIGKHFVPNGHNLESKILNMMWSQNNDALMNQDFMNFRNCIQKYDDVDNIHPWGYSYIAVFNLLNPYIKNKSVADCHATASKYVYAINVGPHVESFTGFKLVSKYRRFEIDHCGEFFWKHMSKTARQDVQQGRATILLDYTQENFVSREQWDDLHEVLRMSEFPPEQVLFFYNTFNGKELYESWYPEHKRRLTVVNCPFLLAWNHDKASLVSESTVLSTRNTIRSKYFTYKINRPKPWRTNLLAYLKAFNHLDKGNWSMLLPDLLNQNEISSTFKAELDMDLYSDQEQELWDVFPKYLEGEESDRCQDINVAGWAEKNTQIYLDSYFDICTETYVENNINHMPCFKHESITEKIYKPMAFYQPFVFMSWPGALAKLRELGFKTFHPFIDESYDNETDYATRMKMIFVEINKLCLKTPSELHEWYWSQWEILKHNHDQLAKTGNSKLFWDSINLLIDKTQ